MDTKLTITLKDTDPDAVDSGRGLPESITVQYNPTTLTLRKGAQLAEQNIPGLDSPLIQFVRGQTEKLSVELILDAGSSKTGEIKTDLKALYQLVKMQPKTHAPPRVELSWGESLTFVGVAESVSRKITLFDRDGTPLRATVSITFREYRKLKEQVEELRLESPNRTKVHVVLAGDRLDSIAFREYGDPTLWREIAGYNRLERPRRLVAGARLTLPPIEALR